MCGVCGVVAASPIEPGVVERMAETIAHRGPDGQGVRHFAPPGGPYAGLGHRRLSIIDLSEAGDQPMASPSGRYWLSYNGEIYNFRALRRELEASGTRFASDCDTEVLAAIWEREGPKCLDRLNGIFAFAVWDERERCLHLVRDRLGVKPLYYAHDADRVAFASEIKALFGVVDPGGLDLEALADYLTFLWVPDPKTMFSRVRSLPPGHRATFRDGELSVEAWWDYGFEPDASRDWAPALRTALDDAIERQQVSDVSLGAFLSGGVDSSAIVAAMARGGTTPSTYTVGFSPEDLAHEILPDDLKHARRFAELVDADYHEQILKPDVVDLLPMTVWHLDVPIADPAAINTYLICRAARERHTVMLSGMGADEIFAGYPRFLAHRIAETLDRAPRPIANLVRGAAARSHPGSPGKLRALRRNAWKFARGAGEDPDERYLGFHSYYSLTELRSVLSPSVVAELHGYDPLDGRRDLLRRVAHLDPVNRYTYLDAKTFLPALNLTYMDKMSMATSTEVRVPLIDDEVVAMSGRIPPDQKLHGFRRKYVLKRSQRGLLPASILRRRKAGFAAPIRSWIVGDLAPLIDESLSTGSLVERGLLSPTAVEEMIKRNAAGLEDSNLRIYALLNLELWLRTFMDTSKPAALVVSS